MEKDIILCKSLAQLSILKEKLEKNGIEINDVIIQEFLRVMLSEETEETISYVYSEILRTEIVSDSLIDGILKIVSKKNKKITKIKY